MKKVLITVVLALSLFLAGCSNVDDFVAQDMLKKSGIEMKEEYKSYEIAVVEGKVAEDGNLNVASNEALTEVPVGSIQVSFAENSNVEIEYFLDSGHTIKIEEKYVYLMPEDSIYAEIKKEKAISNAYEFSGFRVYEYKEGRRFELRDTIQDGLTINFKNYPAGTELSLEPVGDFKPRQISLNDYYKDADGGRHSLSGTWTVNGLETADDKVEIDPISPFTISYEYDADNFSFVSSQPSHLDLNEVNGLVTFRLQESKTSQSEFSVELRPVYREDPKYQPEFALSLDKSLGESRKLTFSAGGLAPATYSYQPANIAEFGAFEAIKAVKIASDQPIEFDLGNYSIPSGKAIKLLIEKVNDEGGKTTSIRLIDTINQSPELILISKGEKFEGLVKSIKVTVSMVDVSAYEAIISPANATLTVTANRNGVMQELEDGELFELNQRVEVSLIPDEGYFLANAAMMNSESYKKSMNFKAYQADIQEILRKYPVEKYVEIRLVCQEAVSKCYYMAGIKSLSDTVRLKEGQEIRLNISITEEGYIFNGSLANFFGVLLKDGSKTIKIDRSMDGTTLSPKDFGLEVVKGN